MHGFVLGWFLKTRFTSYLSLRLFPSCVSLSGCSLLVSLSGCSPRGSLSGSSLLGSLSGCSLLASLSHLRVYACSLPFGSRFQVSVSWGAGFPWSALSRLSRISRLSLVPRVSRLSLLSVYGCGWPCFLVPSAALCPFLVLARAGLRGVRVFLVAALCPFFGSTSCARLRAGRVCSSRLPLAGLGNCVPRSSFSVHLRPV